MPVPKKRTSRSKRNMRRSHHGLTAKNPIICPSCAEQMLPHKACPHCGEYKGRSTIREPRGSASGDAGQGAAEA